VDPITGEALAPLRHEGSPRDQNFLGNSGNARSGS
jgi:hypothetical protein